jgi:hypothetical protein
MIDISLPWRYFISECWHNQLLPTWNPFATLGFPQQADPQTWYPISTLISLFFGYNLYILHYEFVLHIILATFGFRYLLNSIGIRQITTIIIFSVAYICSGFFISNAEHLGWIVSACWIPYIFANLVNYFKQSHIKYLLASVLFLFLLLTGGYPGIFIVTSYCTLFFVIYKIATQYISRNNFAFSTTYKQLFISALVFTAISSVVIYCSFQVRPFLNKELTPKEVMSGPITLESLISIIYPFVVINQTEFLGKVDAALLNSYFGIFSFLLIFWGLYENKLKNIKLLLLGVFFMMIALGDTTPLRAWLYHLPLLDSFRFPALFRIFGIIFFLLFAAKTYDSIDFNRHKKKIGLLFLSFGIAQSLFIFINYSFSNIFEIFTTSYTYLIDSSIIKERLLVQQCFILIIYGLIGILIIRVNETKIRPVITGLFLLELIVFSQLNAGKTVYNQTLACSTIQKTFSKFPQGFPLPSNKLELLQTTESRLPFDEGIGGNKNIYYKNPTIFGYNPYSFKATHRLETSPNNRDIMNVPLVSFFPNSSESEPILYGRDASNLKLKILDFNPQKIRIGLDGLESGRIVFNQNYFSGWKVRVGNVNREIKLVNYCLMSTKVNRGDKDVEFYFEPTYTRVLWILSSISFLLLSIYLSLQFYQRKDV